MDRGLNIQIYGDPAADTVLIQMAGDHELEEIEAEFEDICRISGRSDFCLAAVKAEDWNKDLSPWPAPAVFGNEDFGGGAEKTLRTVLEQVIPSLEEPNGKGHDRETDTKEKEYYIGGYSLAGLFALWAVYQSKAFAGAAAVSPSVWFPGFTDFMRSSDILTDRVYLSLGDKEAGTRNPVMSKVADEIRKAYIRLQESGTLCTFEWNPGNHFREPALRMAKGFAWLLAGQEK